MFTYTSCTMVKPWYHSNFLLSLWIELRLCMHQGMISVAAGKILPAKKIKCVHPKIQRFHRKSTHSLRSTCHSTCPLPQRVLLSKRTSRLYESCLGGRFASAKPICDFEHHFEPGAASFQQISWFSRTTVAPWWNLVTAQTFCSAYGSSWGFACTKIWYQWQLEKYSWRKRIGSFMRKLNFSTEILYIVCALLATQHAHCHKE